LDYQRFYRIGSLLPLAVPSLIGIVGLALGEGGATINISEFPAPAQLLFAAPIWLWLSLVFGGIPYALFAAIALWLLRGKPPLAYFRFSLFAPLLFAAALSVLVAIVLLAKTQPLTGEAIFPLLQVCVLFAAPAIAIGYGYVGLLHAIRPRLTHSESEQMKSVA
jgi:hypothetical protein